MKEVKTEYEPAGRAPNHVLQQQKNRLSSDLLMTSVANGSGSFISILNPKRQIVYANATLTDAFGTAGEQAVGLRMGELIGCRNVGIGSDGCGTSKNCSACGAGRAIRQARLGSAHEEECRILREDGEALDLKVAASPISFDGDRFILFSAVDISDTKRRRSLERIFFHDIMNTATGVRGLSSLAREVDGIEQEQMLELLEITSDHLIDEIAGQRELLAAESNELMVHAQLIGSARLLRNTASLYEAHEVAGGRSIVVEEGIDDVSFVSDPILLGRVIGNLVKNALEAVRAGDVVRLSCRLEGSRVAFSVHNSGVIPEDSQAQIFQRSFSTKGEGRGLGTYGSRLLTERYLKGEISFVSSEAAGTSFAIGVPLTVPGD